MEKDLERNGMEQFSIAWLCIHTYIIIHAYNYIIYAQYIKYQFHPVQITRVQVEYNLCAMAGRKHH